MAAHCLLKTFTRPLSATFYMVACVLAEVLARCICATYCVLESGSTGTVQPASTPETEGGFARPVRHTVVNRTAHAAGSEWGLRYTTASRA